MSPFMKKLFLLVLLLCGVCAAGRAQDIITRQDGIDIQAKVTEILPEVVKYKWYDYLDGPVFTIRRSDILIIRYENGTNEVFGQQAAVPAQAASPQPKADIPAMASFAEGLTVISGDVSVLSRASTGYTVIDYSAAMVGGKPLAQYLKDSGPEYERDWPGDSREAGNHFITQLNKKSKNGLMLQDAEAGAGYIVTLYVQDIDFGFTGGNFVPFANKAGGVEIIGVLEVRDASSGAQALVVAFNKMRGVPAYTQSQRLGWAYVDLVNKLFKLK